MARKKGPLTPLKYTMALAGISRWHARLGIRRDMTKYKLDALVAPTGGPAWRIDLVNGDSSFANSSAAVDGPVWRGLHITVPPSTKRDCQGSRSSAAL